MRRVILTIVAVAIIGLVGGLAYVYSGAYDVAALDLHWAVTQWLMETARVRSIRVHAAGIQPPASLNDQSMLVMGTEHFAAHCAVCHGAPGVPKGDIAAGMYPQSPDLMNSARAFSPGELFWILKNGIKMTGMPAWSDHSDDELWATVGFLEKLPSLSVEDYGQLVMQSMMKGGHHHKGTGAEVPGSHNGSKVER